MVLNIIFICRHHYICKTSLHLLSPVFTTDQIHSAFLSLVSFPKSKVVTERSSNLFTITLLNKIMVILIKVHLNYFKTCCGKDSSETTERKNFYFYSNCMSSDSYPKWDAREAGKLASCVFMKKRRTRTWGTSNSLC